MEEGGVELGTAGKVQQPMPAWDCVSQWLSQCTPLPVAWFKPGFSHTTTRLATAATY